MREAVRRWIDDRFPGARVNPLAEDASTRSFYRLTVAAGTSILMDYGAPFEGESEDQKLAAIFRRAGLPVADILEARPELGCLVLEDLGAKTLEDELQACNEQGETPQVLLDAAHLAGRIARDGSPVLSESARAAGPSLDSERFRFEMAFFLDNFVARHRKIRGEHGRLGSLLESLADAAARTPRPVMCHRDYHSRNILVRESGSLALVDIQDARWGPDTYDLASLIFDAYVDLADVWIEPLIAACLEAAGTDDDPLVRQRLHLVAAQRMIKALGTFGYQIEVAHNDRYMDAISRTLARLDRLLPLKEETLAIHAAFRSLDLFAANP
ncbi:MAG: phosphotransferase [Acidobacteria bacterium]|nr:phosphotransferase [Acidobacteriota bacterium]NIM62769.1 phosphotransferase [Acidobacteriota bacterium]NIO59069.1 phosphotransferase [Acidobacteriota bacterium]NIQ30108.1 phosphotransferase [Acidobacteriota bacterium]NIQ84911.1 phosphotransferase [Acidobacteriota bacterium]